MEKPPMVGRILAAVMVTLSLTAAGTAHAARAVAQPRLSIASPSPGSLVGGLVQVAVAFDAGQFGKVTALELWVNDRFYAGTQIDAANPRGTFNLDLDTLQLRNGQHSLKVRALAGRKVIATDTAVVTVTNGGVDVVPPLVSFNSPMDGDTLSGIATIDVNAADNDRVSLVSIFVNKLPVMLRSTAPYTYSLDTTGLALPDGTLLLEAMAYDRSDNVGKAKPIRVRVRNPVNATPLQPDPAPAGRKATPTASTVKRVPAPKAPVTKAPAAAPTKVSAAPKAVTPPVARPASSPVPAQPRMASVPKLPSAAALMGAAAGPRDVTPPASRPARSAPTVAPAPREDATIVLPLGPSIRASGTAAPEPRIATPSEVRPAPVKLPVAVQPRQMAKTPAPELRAVPRAPRAPAAAPLPKVLPGSPRVSLPVFVVRPVGDGMVKSRTYMVARGDRLSQIAQRHGVTPKSILVANGLADATQLKAGSRLTIPGTFNIAMNNSPIGFDVSPRVERGLPIAPFRQIFEHAGGTVVYYPVDRSVTARKPEKEIQLKIGSKQATVNQAVVIMDRAAFIDNGRTMLPMRFMTEALDMKAEYDPNTGTVYLTRKEGKLASVPAGK